MPHGSTRGRGAEAPLSSPHEVGRGGGGHGHVQFRREDSGARGPRMAGRRGALEALRTLFPGSLARIRCTYGASPWCTFGQKESRPDRLPRLTCCFSWLGQRDSNPRNRHQKTTTHSTTRSSWFFAVNLHAIIQPISPIKTTCYNADKLILRQLCGTFCGRNEERCCTRPHRSESVRAGAL